MADISVVIPGQSLTLSTGSRGAKGLKGDKGDKGDTGDKGRDFLSGSGVPASGLGVNGDTYIDTASGSIYVKASGSWSLSASQVFADAVAAAQAAQAAAEAAETNAETAETAAQGHASNASTSATAAANSATAASGSAATASTNATSAANSATAAGTSATAAAGSASSASSSATAAASSASAASGSASSASGSATAAATSATAAANSATASAGSATTAADSATSAANSATAAASSETAAAGSATAADASATAAAASVAAMPVHGYLAQELDRYRPESSGVVMAFDTVPPRVLVRDRKGVVNFYGDANDWLTNTAPSAKLVRNPSGIYESGTTLRCDHLANGTALGLLCEPAATNLFLNNRSPVTQNITVSAVQYTVSFYGTGSIAFSGAHSATLNGTGTNERVRLTFTPSAGTLTCTVSGSIDYVQLETGPLATSPIITSGSAVTRAADNISKVLSALPFDVAGGQLIEECAFRGGTGIAPGTRFAAQIDDGTTSNRLFIYNAGDVRYSITSSGVTEALTGSAALSDGEFARFAVAYSLNNTRNAMNGILYNADTTCLMPVGPTHLRIGGGVNGISALNGWVRRLIYIPGRGTDTNLQSRSIIL